MLLVNRTLTNVWKELPLTGIIHFLTFSIVFAVLHISGGRDLSWNLESVQSPMQSAGISCSLQHVLSYVTVKHKNYCFSEFLIIIGIIHRIPFNFYVIQHYIPEYFSFVFGLRSSLFWCIVREIIWFLISKNMNVYNR